MTQADGERVGGAYVELAAKDDGSFHKDTVASVDKTFKEVEKRSEVTASNIADDFKRAGNEISNSMEKALQPRGSNGRFVSTKKAGQEAFEAIGEAAQTTSGWVDQLTNALNQLPGVLGKIGGSAPALAALPAVFIALAGAASFAARAIQDVLSVAYLVGAALPGLITGIISSFLILKAATSGVGDAFTELTKKQTKAGAAGVSNARQVADAQRGVLQAQKDLIKAKDDEIKRIRLLALEVQRARVSEKRAADDVLKAQYALQRAREIGTPRAVIEAQIALDEANATLAEAKQKTIDLSKEKQKADKVGVNGSDQVLRAQEQLLDAQDRLAQSQQKFSAGIASQTTAFDGLTKSAQAFVLALVSAKEQLGPVQDALQEAFFKGTAPLIQPIVDNIIELQPELTAVASAFGEIFKEILKFLGSPEAKEGLRSLLRGVSEALVAIKPSIGPLLKAFIGLVGESGDFGKALGGRIAQGLDAVTKFVNEVDIEQVFKDAKEAIRELKPVLSDVGSILKSVFQIFEFFGRYILPEVSRNLTILSDTINMFETVFNIVRRAVGNFFTEVGKKIGLVSDNIRATVAAIPGKISALGGKFLDAGRNLIGAFFRGVSNAGSFATDFARNLAATFVSFFNRNVIGSINRAIKTIQNGFNLIPGLSVRLPTLSSIPALEKGGVSTQATIAQISEGNKKEGILPLEDSRAMRLVGEAIARAGGAGDGNGGGNVVFAQGAFIMNFQGALPTEAQARQIGSTIGKSAANTIERRNIRTTIRSM